MSSLLAHEESIGGIEGIRVCRNAPSISHLLFADDSLVLMKVMDQNAHTLKRILVQAQVSRLVMLNPVFFQP